MNAADFHVKSLTRALLVRGALSVWQTPGIIEILTQTPSTNTDLLAYAKRMGTSTPQRSLLATLHQTEGRGRHGRRWDCPPGHALALSIGLRTRQSTSELAGLTLLCGLSVRDALLQSGAKVSLKWPNDVLDNATHQKLCGILLELHTLADGSSWIVVGIGLNLTSAPPGAAYLGAVDDLNHLVADIIVRFEDRYRTFERQGFTPFIDEFNRAHLFHHRSIVFLDHERCTLRGRFAGVNQQGEALVETDEGIRTVASGELRLRTEEIAI